MPSEWRRENNPIELQMERCQKTDGEILALQPHEIMTGNVIGPAVRTHPYIEL